MSQSFQKHTHKLMRFFLLLSLSVFLSKTSFSQKINSTNYESLVNRTINLISDSYSIIETNPIHYEESMYIDSLFKHALNKSLKEKDSILKINSDLILKTINNNSVGEYEDSADWRRITMRRSQCFAILALICENN